MDTDHCPKCAAMSVVAGRIIRGRDLGAPRFTPAGMRFFNFKWGWFSTPPPKCSKDFRACLTCGHVWTHLLPEDLHAYIDENGTAQTKLKLSPFRKAPPEQA